MKRGFRIRHMLHLARFIFEISFKFSKEPSRVCAGMERAYLVVVCRISALVAWQYSALCLHGQGGAQELSVMSPSHDVFVVHTVYS